MKRSNFNSFRGNRGGSNDSRNSGFNQRPNFGNGQNRCNEPYGVSGGSIAFRGETYDQGFTEGSSVGDPQREMKYLGFRRNNEQGFKSQEPQDCMQFNRNNFQSNNFNQRQSNNRDFKRNNFHKNIRPLNEEVEFDDTGAAVMPSQDPYYDQGPSHSQGPSYNQAKRGRFQPEEPPKVINETDIKINEFIKAVENQESGIGKIVFIQTNNPSAINVIQTAISKLKGYKIDLDQNGNNFSVILNGVVYAEGTFTNKSEAKTKLYEETLEKLKEQCFLIVKNKDFEEIETASLSDVAQKPIAEVPNLLEGSKAQQMMMKMGWNKDKGLGAREQGQKKTVAELVENVSQAGPNGKRGLGVAEGEIETVSRDGLGDKKQNIFPKIKKILKDYAHSPTITVLAFESSFTKEERAQIHKLAQKFNLKTKSEGKDESRRITISKKIESQDLVRHLLRNGCKDSVYTLYIPRKFAALWQKSF